MQATEANSQQATGSLAGAPLAEVADEVYRHLAEIVSRGGADLSPLDRYDDSITIKNADGVVVYCNESHRRVFSPRVSPIGRTAHAYLDPIMASRAESMADLIMGGCPYVEGEHSGPGPDGTVYRMVAHKRSLKELGSPGMALLAVIRVLERSEPSNKSCTTDLAASYSRFHELAERDQEICRLTALGVSSRELGERLGMTTRGIELRKQKAFAQLGVAKAVDLARLLVRLQDRGFVDLGL
ncbi:MAG: PAS domain-containing protein [Planctomycetota bacterium]